MIKPWLVAKESLDTEQLPSIMLAEDPTQSVEAHVLEMQAENNESDLLLRDIGQMSDDLNNLEMIERHISDTHNVSDATTQVVDIALESFCKRWDIPTIKPGIEARAHAADFLRKQVALEGIGSAIATGIKKLIEWLKSLFAKLKTKIAAFFTLKNNILARVERLRKYVESGKYTPKTNVFVTNDVVGGIELDGKLDIHAVVGLIQNIGADCLADLSVLSAQLKSWDKPKVATATIKIGVTSKKGAGIRALPGAIYFHTGVNDDGISTLNVQRNPLVETIKLPVLDKSTMESILSKIEMLYDRIPRALKEMEPVYDSVNQLKSSDTDTAEDKKIMAHMQTSATCLSTYAKNLTDVVTNTSRALLCYAEESVKLSKA